MSELKLADAGSKMPEPPKDAATACDTKAALQDAAPPQANSAAATEALSKQSDVQPAAVSAPAKTPTSEPTPVANEPLVEKAAPGSGSIVRPELAAEESDDVAADNKAVQETENNPTIVRKQVESDEEEKPVEEVDAGPVENAKIVRAVAPAEQPEESEFNQTTEPVGDTTISRPDLVAKPAKLEKPDETKATEAEASRPEAKKDAPADVAKETDNPKISADKLAALEEATKENAELKKQITDLADRLTKAEATINKVPIDTEKRIGELTSSMVSKEALDAISTKISSLEEHTAQLEDIKNNLSALEKAIVTPENAKSIAETAADDRFNSGNEEMRNIAREELEHMRSRIEEIISEMLKSPHGYEILHNSFHELLQNIELTLSLAANESVSDEADSSGEDTAVNAA